MLIPPTPTMKQFRAFLQTPKVAALVTHWSQYFVLIWHHLNIMKGGSILLTKLEDMFEVKIGW